MPTRLATALAALVAASCLLIAPFGANAAAAHSSSPRAHAAGRHLVKACRGRRSAKPGKRAKGRHSLIACASRAAKTPSGKRGRGSKRPIGNGSGSTKTTTSSQPVSVPVSSAPVNAPVAAPTRPSATGTTSSGQSGSTVTSGSSTGSGSGSGSGSGTGSPAPVSGSGSGTGSPAPVSGSGSGTGSPAPVSGSGSGTGSPAPVSVPSHIQTWAYDDCSDGGSNASASLVRQWVSYAEANCGEGGDYKALADCHSGSTTYCDSIQYEDTNWIYAQGSSTWTSFNQDASESWYQHVPGSLTTRVGINSYGGGYLVNQSNPAVQSFFQSYVRNHSNADDGLMMDDEADSLSAELYYASCGCSATNEAGSDAVLVAAHDEMAAAMTHSDGKPFVQIDNALAPNPYLPQGINLLDKTTGVVGLISEGAPEDDGVLDPYYSTLLDQIAYVATKTDSFVVPLSYSDSGASYQPRSRRVQEATMLLGYSAGHLVDWADLEQNSNNLGVWPEEGIYPTDPVQTMAAPGGAGCLAGNGNVCSTGGHNNVQVAPGVYRREFGACYDHGTAFGACATIVNTTSQAVTVKSSWLKPSYSHQITFNGGDVQSGGSIDLTGASFTPGATTVAPQDAILLGP